MIKIQRQKKIRDWFLTIAVGLAAAFVVVISY